MTTTETTESPSIRIVIDEPSRMSWGRWEVVWRVECDPQHISTMQHPIDGDEGMLSTTSVYGWGKSRVMQTAVLSAQSDREYWHKNWNAVVD